jgi:hypothetical protein
MLPIRVPVIFHAGWAKSNESPDKVTGAIAKGRSPSGNGRRVLWGCAEPPSYSLRLRPTPTDMSVGPTSWRGRTHAKAPGSVGGCA